MSLVIAHPAPAYHNRTLPPGMVPHVIISIERMEYNWNWPGTGFADLIKRSLLATHGEDALIPSPLVDLQEALHALAISRRGQHEGLTQEQIDHAIQLPESNDSPNLRRIIGRFLIGFAISYGHLDYIHGYRTFVGAETLGRVRDIAAEWQRYDRYLIGKEPR